MIRIIIKTYFLYDIELDYWHHFLQSSVPGNLSNLSLSAVLVVIPSALWLKSNLNISIRSSLSNSFLSEIPFFWNYSRSTPELILGP